MSKIKYAILIISLPIFILAYVYFKTDCPTYGKIIINENSIDIEYACSIYQQARGLSKRDSILPNQGMLFVFDQPEIRRFTSKDTKIPLSIAFIDERGLIVEIHTMDSMSQKMIISSRPILYALETPVTWFNQHDVRVGDRVYEQK